MGNRKTITSIDHLIPTIDNRWVAASIYFQVDDNIASCDDVKKTEISDYLNLIKESPILIVCSAIGVLRRKYRSIAEFWASQGWVVIVFDYRGIGQSKNYVDNADTTILDWAKYDIDSTISWCNIYLEPQRIVLLGHSIGGQLLGFLKNYDAISSLIIIGSQKGYWRLWPKKMRWLMLTVWRIFPLYLRYFKTLSLMNLAGCESLPKGITLDWCRWAHSSVYLTRDMENIDHSFARYKGRLLSVSMDDDLYAPRKAVDCLTQKYTQADVTRWHILPSDLNIKVLGHSGFFTDEDRNKVFWGDVMEWLTADNIVNSVA